MLERQHVLWGSLPKAKVWFGQANQMKDSFSQKFKNQKVYNLKRFHIVCQLSIYCHLWRNKQSKIFSKMRSKMFINECFLKFSCIRHPLLFTWCAKYQSTPNNTEVESKNAILWKFDITLLKYFLKILLHFLLEDAMPVHLKCKLLFWYQEYFSIAVKVESLT